MQKKRIEILAIKFRRAIEQAKEENRFVNEQMFRNFPNGCCGIVSELLGRFLVNNGIETIYVQGTYYEAQQSHAWLRTSNNIIVDITGDQFKYDPQFLNFCKDIYVGPYSEFHKLFEIEREEVCNNVYPLDDTYIRRHLSRKKLYEIILEYIK